MGIYNVNHRWVTHTNMGPNGTFASIVLKPINKLPQFCQL